jgi:hypothetical protein
LFLLIEKSSVPCIGGEACGSQERRKRERERGQTRYEEREREKPENQRDVQRILYNSIMTETLLTREPTKEEVAEFREAFDMFDMDGGGACFCSPSV